MKILALYQRLSHYMKPFWVMLCLGITANILYALIDAGFTYMMRPFLDKGLIQLDMVFVKKIPLILLVGITVRGIISALGSYCMTSVARSVVTKLRQDVFGHILKLPATFYDKTSSAQFLSKILYDVEQVAQVGADALTDFVQNVCLVLGLLTVMFVLCWQLSLLFLVTVPFVGFIVNKTNRRVRRVSHQVQTMMGRVTEIAMDAIAGYKIVRIFGSRDIEHEKFIRATHLARQNDMKVAVSKAINVSGVQCVIAIGISLIIVVSIQLAAVIQITPGGFLAIMAAMLQLIKPMKTLTTLNATIQRGLAGAESVFQLLDERTEKQDGRVLPTRVEGEVRFESVHYAYHDGQMVLDNVNFHIQPGETFALVGHSGSGKSTIASLLARFYELSSGRILVDGQDIREIELSSLRAQMAYVSQDIVLFNDTVSNNIAYGCPAATREMVKKAAHYAYADEFIEDLPLQYETMVGEKGLLLSGGQRQRIAIARAILKDAPLLILDEATSALDAASERVIQAAMDRVMQNRTTLVIAHRLSTIMHAHCIGVLEAGQLIEKGTHAELLALKGTYARLIENQKDPVVLDLET